MSRVAAIKVTFAFRVPGNGYSLSFYLQGSPSTNFGAEIAKANALATQLNNLTGPKTVLSEIRLQNNANLRQGLVFATNFNESAATGQAPPQTASQIKMYNVTNTADTSFYPRGLGTWAFGSNGRPSDLFKTKVAAVVALLKSDGWGWLGKNIGTSKGPTSILTITANLSGKPVVTLNENWFTAPFFETKVQVSMSGIQGADTLNGTWVVIPSAADQFTFVKPALFNPFVPLSGTAIMNALQFNGFDTGDHFKFTERKVGRPLYAPRGRSRRKRVVY